MMLGFCCGCCALARPPQKIAVAIATLMRNVPFMDFSFNASPA